MGRSPALFSLLTGRARWSTRCAPRPLRFGRLRGARLRYSPGCPSSRGFTAIYERSCQRPIARSNSSDLRQSLIIPNHFTGCVAERSPTISDHSQRIYLRANLGDNPPCLMKKRETWPVKERKRQHRSKPVIHSEKQAVSMFVCVHAVSFSKASSNDSDCAAMHEAAHVQSTKIRGSGSGGQVRATSQSCVHSIAAI